MSAEKLPQARTTSHSTRRATTARTSCSAIAAIVR
nr:MAG TPA: hypothetical protein [Caudoviricetes sp.]DAH98884.1 MAG TPA: hypothetical protein [Caudoviricetes sp.]